MKARSLQFLLACSALVLAGAVGWCWALYIEPAVKVQPSTAVAQDSPNPNQAVGEFRSFDERVVFPRMRASSALNSAAQDKLKSTAVVPRSKSQSVEPVPLGAGMLTRELTTAGDAQHFNIGRMWEAQAKLPYTPSATPASAPDWRITGSVVRGSSTFVLVQIDGQTEPQMLKIGSKLPGGATLIWVRPNVVGVRYGTTPPMDLPVLDGQRDQAVRASKRADRHPQQAVSPSIR
jgi:hypothetical protein